MKKKSEALLPHICTRGAGVFPGNPTLLAWALLIQQLYNKIWVLLFNTKILWTWDRTGWPAPRRTAAHYWACAPLRSSSLRGVFSVRDLQPSGPLSQPPLLQAMHCTADSYAVAGTYQTRVVPLPLLYRWGNKTWMKVRNHLAWNPSNWEAEAGGSCVRGQPQPQSKALKEIEVKEQKKRMVYSTTMTFIISLTHVSM